jgi:hypothetical protein|tara:strand:- start:6332 stop:7303 length:972 start_codon:yes stop_codon:yes gene_type:complete
VKNKLNLNSIERISAPAPHCAFTDLIASPFDQSSTTVFCCYRQASDHVSQDGQIVIVKYSLTTEEKHYQTLQVPDTDLRDPKFSLDGETLYLTTYAKHKCTKTGKVSTDMLSFYTKTGESWSSPHSFGKPGWWLWNMTFFNQTAYGFAYNRSQNRIDFYAGHPNKQMDVVTYHALSLEKHELGYPNESHVLFSKNGAATAVVRRDADSYSAMLGESSPPYTSWTWKDLGCYIGGPVMYALSDAYYLVAGRDWDGEVSTTKIWLLEKETAQLSVLITLPSGGDNSYPGMVIEGDTLFLSYYSSHIDESTRVYLAELSGVNALHC